MPPGAPTTSQLPQESSHLPRQPPVPYRSSAPAPGLPLPFQPFPEPPPSSATLVGSCPANAVVAGAAWCPPGHSTSLWLWWCLGRCVWCSCAARRPAWPCRFWNATGRRPQLHKQRILASAGGGDEDWPPHRPRGERLCHMCRLSRYADDNHPLCPATCPCPWAAPPGLLYEARRRATGPVSGREQVWRLVRLLWRGPRLLVF